MAYLARLIFAVVALAYSLPSAAVGFVYPKTGTQYSIASCNGLVIFGWSASEVAANCVASRNARSVPFQSSNSVGCSPVLVTKSYSVGTITPIASTSNFRITFMVTSVVAPYNGSSCAGGTSTTQDSSADTQNSPATACEAPGQAVAGSAPPSCACPTGTKPQGAQCVGYACPTAGNYSAVTSPDQLVPNAGDGICAAGCGYVPSSWKVGADGKIWATWPFKSSGQFCGGAPSTVYPSVGTGEKNNSNPAPVACGTNMCPGVVNGANVCVACSSQNVQGPSSTSSAPSGSASGADGSTSSTSTSCNGTTCTTTTTTTSTSTGQVTGTKSDSQDQTSWCQENPASPMCKDSLWGGSCAGGFTCDGDAVQCALAQRVHKSACQTDVTDTHWSDVGNTAINAGVHPPDHPYSTADTASLDFASGLNQTEYFGGGCVADMTVPLGMSSVTIPFSRICSSLAMLGNVMVGLCALAACFIVFRS